MARPTKSGLDYFPHDVGLISDRKFRGLKKRYGYMVPVVYVLLLEMIYGERGYYLDYTDPENVIYDILDAIDGKNQLDAEAVAVLIDDLVKCGLFSEAHFAMGILTSKRIQSTYYKATADRKDVSVDPQYWMLDVDEMQRLSRRHSLLGGGQTQTENGVNRTNNDNIPWEYRTDNDDNLPCGTQSKVKQSKVKERKAKQSKEEETIALAGTASAAAEPYYELEKLAALIRDNICPVTSRVRQDLADWLKHMEAGCVEYAILEAARSGARTPKYVYAIMQRMVDEGVVTAGDLEKARVKKKETLSFESDASDYAHYFDGEDIYAGGL